MPARPKFGGPALSKCALERKTPLEDGESECTVDVRLKEPFFSWRMDHDDITSAAKSAQKAEGKDGEKQRCDFAVYQAQNPRDEKSHLVLVECKKTYGGESTAKAAHGQLSDSLCVLRHMAGEKNFRFDLLNPVLVYSQTYVNAATSGDMDARTHLNPIEYNNGREERKARIKVRSTGVEIDDKFVAVRGIKKKG